MTTQRARCRNCNGEGRVANTDNQEPWSAWASLPPGSDLAVRAGIVQPMTCPRCGGSGEEPEGISQPDKTNAEYVADIARGMEADRVAAEEGRPPAQPAEALTVLTTGDPNALQVVAQLRKDAARNPQTVMPHVDLAVIADVMDNLIEALRTQAGAIEIKQRQVADQARGYTRRCATCAETVYLTENGWRCFFCAETFCRQHAADHFGQDERDALSARLEEAKKVLARWEGPQPEPGNDIERGMLEGMRLGAREMRRALLTAPARPA